MGTNLFGAFVPHQWLVCKDIWFGSFQSAFIVVAFGGNFVLDPLQSVCFFLPHFGGNLFRILFSQHLLMPHLAGS
jgi:hypothetical protein